MESIATLLGQPGNAAPSERLRDEIPAEMKVDAWGQPLRFTIHVSGGVSIYSSGPDQRYDTNDDLYDYAQPSYPGAKAPNRGLRR